uniref:MACPF domain-containing protein n=1 Tax=Oryzias latipes TaxID=8090 RepID=A0A3P9IWV6_ORYLA
MFPVKFSLFLLLIFPMCTFEMCTDGTPQECQDAEFVPGSNLAGEGFDISSMERKGAFVLDMNQWKRENKSCTLCTNPYMDNRRQKLPLSVVDWRAKHSCSSKVSSQIYKSSESLVESTTSSVQNNWKVGLSIPLTADLMLAGSHSKVAGYSMEKTKSDKFSFTTQGLSCEYYRLASVLKHPQLHSPATLMTGMDLCDFCGCYFVGKFLFFFSPMSGHGLRSIW